MAIPSPALAALFDPVLAWLDAGGDEQYNFDMRNHYEPCGSTCCIVGALAAFHPELNSDPGLPLEIWATRTERVLISDFGMSYNDVQALFYSWQLAKHNDTKHAAIRVRHWIKTGEVIL